MTLVIDMYTVGALAMCLVLISIATYRVARDGKDLVNKVKNLNKD